MPNGCVITRYAELSDFLYNGFAIRLRIFSCLLARSYFLFLFLPIVRRGTVRSNVTAENLRLCRQQCPVERAVLRNQRQLTRALHVAVSKKHRTLDLSWSSQHFIVQINAVGGAQIKRN